MYSPTKHNASDLNDQIILSKGDNTMCRNVVTIIISLYVLMVYSASASVPRGVNLSNMTTWDIIIAQDAPPSEIYAAEEFQNHFTQASNIRLPTTLV